MKKLNEIIDWYGSDKNLSGYTPYYVEIFESIREKKIDLLEIGIGTVIQHAPSSMANTKIKNYKPGASLRSWQEYFPYEAQLNTFDNLFSRVRPGGYYIIEDIEGGEGSPIFNELEKKLNGLEYKTSSVKNLIIIWKP